MTTPHKSSRLRTLIKAVLAVGLMLCLLAVVAEVVLRVVGFGNLEIYEPDPLLFWRLKPNQDCFTKIDRHPVRINSHGTRGREFAVPKPGGVYRILMLGDSRTFGWGLAEAETYAALVEKSLQGVAGPAQRIEVINAGVNAWSFQQMAVFFRDRALLWQPDAVVLADANLWTQFSEQSSPEFVQQFMNRVRLKNLLRHSALYHFVIEVQLEAFYQRHRTKFIPVDPKQDTLFKEQQQADPDAMFRKAVHDLCSVAQSNRVAVLLAYLPTQTELLAGQSGNNVLRVKQQAAQKFGVGLADLTPEVGPRAKEIYLPADPVHFNREGNEIIARRLATELQPLVRQ